MVNVSENFTQIDRTLILLTLPDELLEEDKKQAFSDEILGRLHSNEHIRTEIWAHFMPILIFALIFYILFSFLWLYYNIRLYNRQQRKVENERETRYAECNRRLDFYNQIPVESNSDEVELVRHVKISET